MPDTPTPIDDQRILNFDLKVIEGFIALDAERKTVEKKNRDYYLGDQKILHDKSTYADGMAKAHVVTNWIKSVANSWTGAFSPYRVSLLDETQKAEEGEPVDEDPGGIAYYNSVVKDNNLIAVDIRNRRNALVGGRGVEVHSFSDKKVVITAYDPVEWTFVYDTDGMLILAIRKVELSKGQVYQGEGLTQKTDLLTVYTETEIFTYTRDTKEAAVAGDGWQLESRVPHHYDQIPVVVWVLNEAAKPLITAALLTQQDEFNEIDSLNGDSVRFDVDSLLKIWGFSADFVKANETVIRQNRVIPLGDKEEGNDAEYLTRSFDNERIRDRLKRTREHIHIEGELPDTAEMVGATGSTSAIALSMAYTPMRQNSQGMIAYMRKGVDKRIELMNAIQGKREGPIIQGYEVTISFIEPINHTEIWGAIQSLTGITSHSTQLRLLPEILDVDAELALIQAEEDHRVPDQAEIAARPEAIAAAAESLTPVLTEIFENINAATVAGVA